MVYTDRIVKDLEMSYTGIFDLKEFLNIMKKLFDRYNYDLDEKNYIYGMHVYKDYLTLRPEGER